MSRFYAPDEEDTRGAPPFAPPRMVCLLLYASCVGVFSSRKIAQAAERTLACLAIAGEAGWVKRGTVSTDGTTLPGHTLRHKAIR